MPPGTFMGPPNALTSQQSQERSLSLGAEEASVGPDSPMGAEPPTGSEPPVDPALLEPTEDGPPSPGISPEDSSLFLAEFKANLPQHLSGWLGAREPGVPYLPPYQDLVQPETPQRPVSLVPSSLAPSPSSLHPGLAIPVSSTALLMKQVLCGRLAPCQRKTMPWSSIPCQSSTTP